MVRFQRNCYFVPRLPHLPFAISRALRAGFTLVELLVVVAIIGLLLAILVPAVQQSREAARSCQCQNRLRQLSLASLTFESDRGALPVGCLGCRDSSAQPRFRSWIAELLPFLDEQSVFDSIDTRRPVFGNDNLQAGQEIVTGLLCPSTRSSQQTSSGSLWHGRAFTDYGGIYGVEGDGCQSDDMRATQTLAKPFLGVMLYETATPLRSIVDGTSHTVAIGEMLVRRQPGECEWINGHHLFAQEKSTPVNSASGLGNDLGSPHPGGAWSTFCDGHVGWLSNEMDQQTLNALLTKSGKDR